LPGFQSFEKTSINLALIFWSGFLVLLPSIGLLGAFARKTRVFRTIGNGCNRP